MKTDLANTVAETPGKTPDGVWMAIALDASNNDLDIDDDKQSDSLSECPDLVINNDEQSDWLSECSEASIWVDEDAEGNICTLVDITMLVASVRVHPHLCPTGPPTSSGPSGWTHRTFFFFFFFIL